jgi:nucleotide-binding universal stress UspA family protein
MIRTILVPLDGSAFGEHALPLALGIARRAGATVRLVHICATPAPHRFRKAQTLAPTDDRQHAEPYLAQLAGVLEERWQVPVRSAVLDGPPAPTFCAEAIARHADLVVMTTHGYGPLSRAWLGSVAQELIRTLPMPVLLTRPHGEPVDLLETVDTLPFARILLPLDGSPLAEQVLPHALALGSLCEAEYTVVQALNPPSLGYAPAAHVANLSQQILDEWMGVAHEYLAQVAVRLRSQGAPTTTCVVLGAPAPAIIDYASSHAIDLIAMATHSRSGAARLLLGSVAERVLQLAGVPVLLFHAAETPATA